MIEVFPRLNKLGETSGEFQGLRTESSLGLELRWFWALALLVSFPVGSNLHFDEVMELEAVFWATGPVAEGWKVGRRVSVFPEAILT